MSNKISIRFYKDHEVRAIWSEEERWYFSIVDIIAAITKSPRPRVYWGTVKNRQKSKYAQLYSKCIQLKLASSDGKRYATDCFAQEDIEAVIKTLPTKNTSAFLDWFTYSDNTIDGKSRKKAYSFWESNLIADDEVGRVMALQKIHAYIFGGLYDFAGKIRTVSIYKGNTLFCLAEYLHREMAKIEKMPQKTFDQIVDKYVEMNMAHPFMEGNGRSTRIWLDLIFKKELKLCVDWSKINKKEYLEAMIKSEYDPKDIKALLKQALTDKINDRELFMKGIDYSYYYEQED
ncbi:MAG: Fic family protein [Bacteroidales bacterium]|jgi:cell filamentation protein|nr:Fic family protein [Bacteroidales bacterium]